MNQNTLRIAGLTFWIAALSAHGLEPARTNFYANTPIRVLLDKAGRTATLESPLRTLFYKVKHPGGWIPLGPSAKLNWSEKTREIRVESGTTKYAAPILF